MLKKVLFNYWNKLEKEKQGDEAIHPKSETNHQKKDGIQVVDEEETKKKKRKRWWIVAITAMIIAVLITVLVLVLQEDEKQVFNGAKVDQVELKSKDAENKDISEAVFKSGSQTLTVSNLKDARIAYQFSSPSDLGTMYDVYLTSKTYIRVTVKQTVQDGNTIWSYAIGNVNWTYDTSLHKVVITPEKIDDKGNADPSDDVVTIPAVTVMKPKNEISLISGFSVNAVAVDGVLTNGQTISYKDDKGTDHQYTITEADLAVVSNFSNMFVNGVQSWSFREQSFDWAGLLISFLPFLIYIAIFVIIYKSFKKQSGMAGGGDSIFGFGKSQDKMVTTNIKFADVAGIKEEKFELIEIVDYLKKPERYAAMGARTPRGVMLYGPPGTGKTLLAKAVAGEAGVPFFQVSGSAFDDMLVGSGAKRVRDLFTKARKAAPAIIFIDEIDSVAAKRGKNDIVGGGGIADQTINQLLAEMDGFNTESGIVIIAATNRLDVLDDALLRPGRFDRQVQITLPDIKERREILEIHAKNKNISARVDLEEIARRTPGFSGAQLENVLNEATLLAVRNDRNVVKLDDIDEAIDRTIGGPAKTSRVVSADEKKQIAYHEAGHALVGLFCKGADVVQKITIIPRGNAAGYTMQTPKEQELSIQKKSDLLDIIRTTLGGRVAEEVVYGPDAISTGASNDFYKITNIVRAMVMQLGMTSVGKTQFVPSEGSQSPFEQRLYSENTALKIDQEIEKIIETEYQKATKIINDNRKELDLIVESLLILETIVKSQIDYIHENLALPPEAIAQQKKAEESAKKAAEADANETIEKQKDIPLVDSKDKDKESKS